MSKSSIATSQIKHVAEANFSTFKRESINLLEQQSDISKNEQIYKDLISNDTGNFIRGVLALEDSKINHIEVVKKLLDNSDKESQKLGIRLLGKYVDIDHKELLEKYINSKDNELRIYSLISLQTLSVRYLDLTNNIENSIFTPNLGAQLLALKIKYPDIINTQSKDLIKELIDTKLKSDNVADNNTSTINKLKIIITSSDVKVTKYAVEALNKLKTKEAEDVIVDLLNTLPTEKKNIVLNVVTDSIEFNKQNKIINTFLSDNLDNLYLLEKLKKRVADLPTDLIIKLINHDNPTIREYGYNFLNTSDNFSNKNEILTKKLREENDSTLKIQLASSINTTEAFDILLNLYKEPETLFKEDLKAILKQHDVLKTDKVRREKFFDCIVNDTNQLIKDFHKSKFKEDDNSIIAGNIQFLSEHNNTEYGALLYLAVKTLDKINIGVIFDKLVDQNEKLIYSVLARGIKETDSLEKLTFFLEYFDKKLISNDSTEVVINALKTLVKNPKEKDLIDSNFKDYTKELETDVFKFREDGSTLEQEYTFKSELNERFETFLKAVRYNFKNRERVLVEALVDPQCSNFAAEVIKNLGLKDANTREELFRKMSSNNSRVSKIACNLVEDLGLTEEAKLYAYETLKKNQLSEQEIAILFSVKDDPKVVSDANSYLNDYLKVKDMTVNRIEIAKKIAMIDPERAASIYLEIWSNKPDPHFNKQIMHGLEKTFSRYSETDPSATFHQFLIESAKYMNSNSNEIVSIVNKMKEFNLSKGFRFNKEDLNKIIKGREDLRDGTLPSDKDNITYFAGTEDHNGAMSDTGNIFFNNINNSNILYFEIGDDHKKDLLNVSEELNTKNIKSNLVLYNMHGQRDGVSFGKNQFTLNELKSLKEKRFGEILAKNGQVIVVSCSTASGVGLFPDFASTLREIYPQASYNGIQAPVIDSNISSVIKIFGQYATTFDNNPNILYRND